MSDLHAKGSVMPVISEYIAQALTQTLPQAVEEKTKFHFLDTVASMVSGSQMLAGERAQRFLLAQGPSAPQATVLGTQLKGSAIHVAMVNGMFGHADETDDSHAESLTHPGCGIVASVLAAGELYQKSGSQMLKAMALGYDVCCRLTKSLHAYQFRVDGHSSHTFGPNFGAAAAAGALAGVSAREARYLLSYAAQQASGVACWMRDKDHIEKAFDFGGMPARNGVSAAVMVINGFTGVEDVFSGERNFYDAYGVNPLRSALGEALGERYEIMRTSIKRWTVGSPIQAPLDCLDTLMHAHTALTSDLEHIKAIRVKIPHESLSIVNNREMPEICLQHLIALMLLERQMSFDLAHARERMLDPRVLNLRARVSLEGSDELSQYMPTRQGIVEIEFLSGQVINAYTKDVKGTPDNPMNRAELERKGMQLMAPVLGEARSKAVCALIWNMERLTEARELTQLLQTDEVPPESRTKSLRSDSPQGLKSSA